MKNKVPPRPHRHFIPVTLPFDGQVAHKDSAGTNTTLNSGDVGWMVAGKGIVHDESMRNPSQSEAGLFHAVQLWINLPVNHKLITPAYKTIIDERLPVWQQQGAQLRIIAGQYQELKGPAPVYSPILLAHGIFVAGARAFIEIPASFEVALYVLEGALTEAEHRALDEGELAIWKKEGEGIQLVAEQDSQFLLLAGEPVQEPLATYGPFVMNRPDELLLAIWAVYSMMGLSSRKRQKIQE